MADIGRESLPPAGVHATIVGPMRCPTAIRRVLVCALAAWMTLCCCEKRILAHSFDSSADAHRSCCADDCCSDEGGGDSHRKSGGESSCSDGCCTKAAFAAPVFSPDIDTIGTQLPVSLHAPAATDDPAAAGRLLTHDDRSEGEPPPRLALVISRRLRI